MNSGSSKKTLIIVLSIVGGLGLLVVLACAGLIYWGSGMFAELQVAQAGADTFLDQLAAGKVDEAYRATAPAFQAKTTAEEFQKLVEQYPAFTDQTRRSTGGMRIYQRPGEPQAVIQYNLAGPHNSVSVALSLVKVGDQWKVEGVNVP